MSRATPSTSFITPIKSDGTAVAPGGDAAFVTGRGVFTLVLGTTYYFEVGSQDMSILHGMLFGDAAIIITSATWEETDLSAAEASAFASGVPWVAIDAARMTATAEGAGWTAASDVGAATGGAAGVVAWNIPDHGARRARLAVVVGATGGEARLSVWGKE